MARATNKRRILKEVVRMNDIKRETLEMDEKEAKAAEDFDNKMRGQGYEKCKVCEHWCEDLTNGICDSCIDDIVDSETLEGVFEYANTLGEEDELVLYTQYLFSRNDVIEILKREALEAYDLDSRVFDNEIREYITNNTGYYLDYLEEKGAL